MKRAWKWVLAVVLIVLALCTAGFVFLWIRFGDHGPPPVTVEAVVKPPSGGQRGTVTIVFKTLKDWYVCSEHSPTVKVTTPKGIVLSPVYPGFVNAPDKAKPMTYSAYLRPPDYNNIEFHYEVLDKHAVPAKVKLSVRYASGSDEHGEGYQDANLVARIPAE